MYWHVPDTNVRILGSMHVLPARNSGLPCWAIEAFDWAELLVFESDPPAILPHLQAPNPPNLQDDLKPTTWEALRALWPTSAPFPSIEAARPWAVLLLSPGFTQKTAHGIESQFMQWASEQSKPIQFLESGEDVAAALGSAPTIEICEALELLVSDLTAPQRSLEAMYAAWLQADLPALIEVANQSPMFRLAGLRAAVLERRNREWAPSLRELMKTPKRTLVAVGALHLHGPGNAIECCGRDAQLISMVG